MQAFIKFFLYNSVLQLEVERKLQNKRNGRKTLRKLRVCYDAHFEGNNITDWQTAKNIKSQLKKFWYPALIISSVYLFLFKYYIFHKLCAKR